MQTSIKVIWGKAEAEGPPSPCVLRRTMQGAGGPDAPDGRSGSSLRFDRGQGAEALIRDQHQQKQREINTNGEKGVDQRSTPTKMGGR